MQLKNRILCGLALSTSLLMAQADPPGRVARLSYVYGAVSFRPAGVDDWAPVDFNRPFTTGDHLFVEFAGTAELQLGSAALRMKTASSLEFLNLDDSNVQLRVTEGSLIIRLRYLGPQDSFEVDTPNLAFTLQQPGEYRFDVKPDTSTTFVTLRGGQGELTGPDQAFTVQAGEQVAVSGADQPNYQTAGAPPVDQFDTWSEGRDQRDDQSPSARYVSRQLVGYQDLDQYGSWRTTPEYGAVWVPNGTPNGWAPYHNGHWLWMDPWGWTWVDDAPWGFAPFHYGRWAYVSGYWGWVPGPVAERPVYAPALVAWVGGGAVGGGVAWFALGPREVYVPSYHTSPVYLNRINVTNTVIVNNVNITNVNITNVQYVNRAAPGAVMAVQQTAFANARPVQSAAIVVRPEALRSATVIATAAVPPTRASVVKAAAPGARVAQPPAALQSRAVIAKRTPPPPAVPFAQKQQALAANGGRPLDTSQVQQIRQSQPPAARPSVRQVQARTPTPAPQAPVGKANIPSPAAPQRPEAAPPTAPSPAVQRPAAVPQSTPAPAVQRPAAPAPSAPAPAVQRPAAPAPSTPTPAAPRPAVTPLHPAQTQAAPNHPEPTHPAPNQAKPNEAKPTPKKDGDKKNENKKDEKKKEEN
jgi:hypothetical protein